MPGRKLTLQIILTKTQMLLEMLQIFIWGIWMKIIWMAILFMHSLRDGMIHMDGLFS